MEIIYIILFVCYACYSFSRKSVTYAMPKLIEEGMDKSSAGLIISCQNLAFAISKFFAGVMSDKVNPKLMFASGLLLAGIVTTLFSSSSSTPLFCVFWFLNGLAQGCGWPSCAKILRERAAPSQFGTLWSILSSAYNVAGALSPLLSAYMILNFGWRSCVMVSGVVSIVLGSILLSSWLLFGKATTQYYSTTIPTKISSPDLKEKTKNKIGVMDLAFDPFLWLVSVSYGVTFCAKTATVDWGQMYLIEERNLSQYQASAFTSSVEIGGFVGRIAAGYFTDFFVRRQLSSAKKNLQSKPTQRLSVGLLFMLGSLIFNHLFVFHLSTTSSTMWLSMVGTLMGLCYYGLIAIFGISSSESAPSYLSGTSNAIASLAANVGATISGLPFSYIAKIYSWEAVFMLLELATFSVLVIMYCFRNLNPKFLDRKKEM
ncbi:glucose-6-phosphate exchanger SLC37A4-like [Uloborus diversus]|uniref:glucose-6-phosphate exchanger SLC37A4-like n=1 Tax=Uloborus diversus TaxID=327109 RepID=UPI00240A3B7A|nr:glucose-6-phosphate exchanger SLC37A4-like [Uloborus diversus]